MSAITRRLLMTEIFMRIRLTAWEKEMEDDMEWKLKRVQRITKHCNLRNAVSQWRSVVLDSVRTGRE